VVKLTVVAEHPRAEARRAFSEKAATRLRRERRERRLALEKRVTPITEACELLRKENRNWLRRKTITVRPEFLYRDRELVDTDVNPEHRLEAGVVNEALRDHLKESLEERPPLGQLVFRDGPAMTLHLTALAVAALRTDDGDEPDFEGIRNVGRYSWATFIGDPARTSPSRARRHVVDALNRLEDARLVQFRPSTGAHQLYDGWTLLREDGAGDHGYTVPRDGLRLPFELWENGWVAALHPSELACYLMFRHQAHLLPGKHVTEGVSAAPRVREQRYGITDSVYSTCNELLEYGLIERTNERPTESVRELPRYRLVDQTLELNAVQRLLEAYEEFPTPTRIARYDGSASQLPAPGH
jgi:hypothetical protein